MSDSPPNTKAALFEYAVYEATAHRPARLDIYLNWDQSNAVREGTPLGVQIAANIDYVRKQFKGVVTEYHWAGPSRIAEILGRGPEN